MQTPPRPDMNGGKRPPFPENGKDPQGREHRFEASKDAPRGGMMHPGRFMEKPKLKDAKGTVRRLLKYLVAVRWSLLIAVLALLASTVMNLIQPRYSGDLINLMYDNYGINKGLVFLSTFVTFIGTNLLCQVGGRIALQKAGRTPSVGRVSTQALLAGLTATIAVPAATVAGTAATVGAAPLSELVRILGIMFAFGVGSALLSLLQQFMLVRVSQHTVRVLRNDLFDRVMKLPLRYLDSKPHGELMSRLTNDVGNVSNMLSNTLTQVLSSAITLVVALYWMLYYSWQLTLVSFITIPLSMLVIRKITKFTGKLFKRQQAALGELNGIVEETVTGARVVKVFSREDNVIADFDASNAELTECGTKATIYSSCIGPLMNMVNNISFALMCGVGGYLVVAGVGPNVGMIQAFLQYSRQFQRPFNEIANQVTMLQSALAGAERVFEVMDTEPEPEDADDALGLSAPKGAVEFKNATFGYNPEAPILKNISFEAKPGETIALVGPTGAGKTTIVNLLMRFYDIDSGEILIDGHDIKAYRRQALRDSMGMVLQDVYMFAGTVKDNIRYGKLDATDEEIIRAAKTANCHEFIERLPNGYDTELSEAAANLSQGQRQLLSIARAVLADPAVLILDEATSSVDTRTEMNIQQAMLSLMKGRTSFVIAHRLSTIRGADQILVIDHGEIIERGTHESLVKAGGFYANLLNSQYRGVAEGEPEA